MLKKNIIFLLLVFSTSLFCQNNFYRDTTVALIENNIKFKNAWAGGVNSAQFHEIDLDLDGKKDLIVFDKTGNKLKRCMTPADRAGVWTGTYEDDQ